jgi:hypothetical protein
MKSHTRLSTLMLGLTLFGAVAANAQGGGISAHIPFAFTAGSTTMNAGTYTVSRLDGSPSVLLVRGATQGVFLMGSGAGATASHEPTRLVFHKYGSQYFLRQVWFDGSSGYTLPETSEERQWAERTGKMAAIRTITQVAAAR